MNRSPGPVGWERLYQFDTQGRLFYFTLEVFLIPESYYFWYISAYHDNYRRFETYVLKNLFNDTLMFRCRRQRLFFERGHMGLCYKTCLK